jgi:hypothetical protein
MPSRLGLDKGSRGHQCADCQCSSFASRDQTHLVTTVVSGTGKTLRVLVGQHRSVGLHDSERSQVLRVQPYPSRSRSKTYLGSDKLQTRELPPSLLLNKRVDLGIGILQGSVKILVLFRSATVFLNFLVFPSRS